MSTIIIDGYNLIGIGHDNLREERNSLISRLATYSRAKRHDLTVVFDGWRSGSHREEAAVIAGVKVIYSRLGDKADLVIKKIIDTADREFIVITSDRDIMAHAWSGNCVPVESAIFESYLERSEGAPQAYAAAEEDEDFSYKKGTARTPSKKDKALARVLKKL